MTAGSEVEFMLENEFAHVIVKKVHTRNGERLAILSPQLGTGITLCPLALESLTWQTPEVFSSFLDTPFGPEAEAEVD